MSHPDFIETILDILENPVTVVRTWTKRLKRNEENNVAISLAEIFMMICQESITRYERVFNEKHFNCSGVCAQPGIIALLA